jgi:hypothetical protein
MPGWPGYLTMCSDIVAQRPLPDVRPMALSIGINLIGEAITLAARALATEAPFALEWRPAVRRDG